HGNWLSWLECEFGWTEKTAENYINVYKFSGKFENFSNLDLPLSGLYLLAAPSTPEPAKGEVIERAESGEKLPVDEIKRVVEKHRADKSRRQPAHRSTKPCAAADVGALAAHKTDLRSDIGATNGGELERLQARIRELEDQFQREKTRSLGLKSEIADLQEAAAKAQRSVG